MLGIRELMGVSFDLGNSKHNSTALAEVENFESRGPGAEDNAPNWRTPRSTGSPVRTMCTPIMGPAAGWIVTLESS